MGGSIWAKLASALSRLVWASWHASWCADSLVLAPMKRRMNAQLASRRPLGLPKLAHPVR